MKKDFIIIEKCLQQKVIIILYVYVSNKLAKKCLSKQESDTTERLNWTETYKAKSYLFERKSI